MIYQLKYSPIAEDDLDRVWDEVWEASQNFDMLSLENTFDEVNI